MAKERTQRFNLIFRLICFLLAITSFTCVALARYISSKATSGTVGIDGFRGSIQVSQNLHNSSFFNTEYKQGDSVMNHPYLTDFKVSNCNLDADGKLITDSPSGVDVKYETLFYIPKDFAEVAAFQLSHITYETIGGTEASIDPSVQATREVDTQVTPIYTFGDLLAAAQTGGTVTMPVASKNAETGEEYYESYDMLLEFKDNKPTVQETFTVVTGSNGTIVATAKAENGDVITTITFEEETIKASVGYSFQCLSGRMNASSEQHPTLLNPLDATCEQDVVFYKIRISRREFVLSKNIEDTDTLRMRIIPTKSVGHYETEADPANPQNNQNNESNMPFDVWYQNKRNFDPKPTFRYSGKDVTAKFYNETVATDPTNYNSTNGYFTAEITNEDGTTTAQNVYPNTCITVGHPMRINAIFMQASL